MKQLSYSLALAGLLVPQLVPAAQDTWVNNGTIVSPPPQIDATNVINNGILGPWATTTLFDTSNTKNFTNAGTISGSIGFRFDQAPRNSSGQLIGARRPLANFHNRNSGNVQSLVGTTIAGFLSSQMWIDATNLVNQGFLTVGADGLLKMSGGDVNLSRGRLGVLSVGDSAAIGSFNDSPFEGLFYPDAGITDFYWGQTNLVMFVNAFNSDAFVTPPPHDVEGQLPDGTPATGTIFLGSIPIHYSDTIHTFDLNSITATNMDGSLTNVLVRTNELRQAVFVAVDPTVSGEVVSITWLPSSDADIRYFSSVLTINYPTTNLLTSQVSYDTAFFADELAGENALGLLQNYLTTLGGLGVTPTFRPTAYTLSRITQAIGFGGDGPVYEGFFFPSNSVTNRVEATYAAYSGDIDNILYRPPTNNIPTNWSGRLEIKADQLDMSRSRLRGEGLVSIQTSHLITSSNAAVDCENLSLDLGSTNGLLRIQDLTKSSAARMRGETYSFSCRFTNEYLVITENWLVNTNGDPPELVPITNTVDVLYHATVFDGRFLTNSIDVNVVKFRAAATNIVMEDDANVNVDAVLTGDSFTLNGTMSFSGLVPNWGFTNAPTLKYFTNNGTFIVTNEAHFGDDGPQGYLAFVNNGDIQAQGQNIDATYVELNGNNLSLSGFGLSAQDAKITGGNIAALGDINLTSGTLKLDHAVLSSGNRITLAASDAIYDDGASSANELSTRDGIILQARPAGPGLSDLLGTTIESSAPNFAAVSHVWAATNRGPVSAGFSNNVAIGRLNLTPEGFDPLFVFSGVGANSALYVDFLDLSQLTDYAAQIEIDPNMVVYYAAASLSFVPGGSMTPEEFLDGQFGGRLRWVSSFAGPNSSIDVLVNGTQTMQFNAALRNSKLIDSDGDGIPNYFDYTPFDGVTITSVALSSTPAGVVVSWDAAPNTVYRLESSSTIGGTDWTTVAWATNSSPVAAKISAVDTTAGTAPGTRYYRVTYNPAGY